MLKKTDLDFRSHLLSTKRRRQLPGAGYELLGLLNSDADLHDLMKDITAFLQTWSGCEAVGIRLRDHDDFPYFETRGFPREFVKAENSLCAKDLKGQIERDDIGNPVIECMCGNVLCERSDPSKPFFTSRGSFWSNCTTELLASTTDADRQARTRNRCNGEGYESVALVALRAGKETFGLIQINDRRKNRFTAEFISTLEQFAGGIAVALAHRNSEQALRESEKNWAMTFNAITDPICIIGIDRKIIKCNSAMARLVAKPHDQIPGHTCCELVHGSKTPIRFCPFNIMMKSRKREMVDFKDKNAWFKEISFPILSDTGAIQGAVHIFENVSSEKRAEENMVRKNIAFEEIVAHIADEKKSIIEYIDANVREVILPLAEKMGNSEQQGYKKLLIGSLKELISSFGKQIGSRQTGNLTAKEKEICSMIRSGMKNKEIAAIQGTAISTVETERKFIRKKLGLTNKKTNLVSYLQDLQ